MLIIVNCCPSPGHEPQKRLSSVPQYSQFPENASKLWNKGGNCQEWPPLRRRLTYSAVRIHDSWRKLTLPSNSNTITVYAASFKIHVVRWSSKNGANPAFGSTDSDSHHPRQISDKLVTVLDRFYEPVPLQNFVLSMLFLHRLAASCSSLILISSSTISNLKNRISNLN